MAINLVISLECQSGKTTWVINKILDNPEQDHFLFTYDKNVVKEDAIAKFYEEAGKRNSTFPRLITNKEKLREVFRDRNQGNYYPVVCILLGNISNFKEAKSILSSSKHTGIKQIVYLDEIHRYTLGEDMKSTVQIDNFVNEMILNRQSDELWVISATPHDIFQTDLVFNHVEILRPYEGFNGLRDAHPVILDEKVFEEVNNSFKLFKHEGIDSDLPQELKDVLDMYLSKDTLINLNSQKLFHSWFASKIIDGGSYNGDIKSLVGNFVGKLSMAMSSTFADHNKILYWNKMGRSAQVGAIVQELGRVNGRKKPVIITTQKVWDKVLKYLNYMEEIIEEQVYLLPPKERQAWCSSYIHEDPSIIPGAKHRDNRVITEMKVPVQGNLETCNEIWMDRYLPKIYSKPWIGKTSYKIMAELELVDPLLHDYIESNNLTKLADTETRHDKNEGSIWDKHRERDMVRFGKTSREGYVAICIRKSDETGFESFHDVDGNLWSDKSVSIGSIMTKEEQELMKAAEEKAYAQFLSETRH